MVVRYEITLKKGKGDIMKIGKILSLTACSVLAGSLYAGSSTMNFANVYEKECQGCQRI